MLSLSSVARGLKSLEDYSQEISLIRKLARSLETHGHERLSNKYMLPDKLFHRGTQSALLKVTSRRYASIFTAELF